MEHDSAAHESSLAKEAALAEGYRQMAADIEHEMEAEEWAEALIGDVASDEG
jgi:vacuolar-type H+-ATPase catalytic subunit A/Vma1